MRYMVGELLPVCREVPGARKAKSHGVEQRLRRAESGIIDARYSAVAPAGLQQELCGRQLALRLTNEGKVARHAATPSRRTLRKDGSALPLPSRAAG